MNADIILEAIYNWEYFWWALLSFYIIISETIYFLSCKYSLLGQDEGWVSYKFFSFFTGVPVLMMGAMISLPGMALISSIVNDPIKSLKVTGIIVVVLVGLSIFLYSNYRVWERYN